MELFLGERGEGRGERGFEWEGGWLEVIFGGEGGGDGRLRWKFSSSFDLKMVNLYKYRLG
jgi:hypothetical protein